MPSTVYKIASLMVVCVGVTSGYADRLIEIPDAPEERPLLKSIYAGSHDLQDFLEDETKAVVFVFISQVCPVAQQYVPRLNELDQTYRTQGIQFVAVYSNSRVNLMSMARHAHDADIHFLAMLDHEHRLADLLGVEVTPEVVVVDAKMIKRYQGAIDDQFTKRGRTRKADKEYLLDAIEAVVNDGQVARPHVPPSGCRLERHKKLLPTREVTYHRDIEPIFQRKCQCCHRAGNVAPFELLTYEDAYYSSATIAEVVEERRMPPWHGDVNPKFGKFAHDRRLTEEEIGLILAWADADGPRGEPADAPAAIDWPDSDAWSIGEPDFIYKMEKPFQIPRSGVLDYQFFRIRLNFPEDRWVQAVELKPGNVEVVHHITMHLVESSDKNYSTIAGMLELYGVDNAQARMIGDYVPGDPFSAKTFSEGLALRLPRNSDVIFEIHYTPNNREATTDRSSVGFRWSEAPPQNELRSMVFRKPVGRFMIPPGAHHFRMEDSYYFREDVYLDAIRAHFHLRGKSYRLELVERDEITGQITQRETVFTIPAWDLDWQRTYELDEPLAVMAGQELLATGHFDNSKWNPNNPDSTRAVPWGQQTYDEMFNSRFIVRQAGASHDRTSPAPPSPTFPLPGSQTTAVNADAFDEADEVDEVDGADGVNEPRPVRANTD